MAVALIILSVVCGWLLAWHIRGILEIRSLNRQLEELEREVIWNWGCRADRKTCWNCADG